MALVCLAVASVSSVSSAQVSTIYGYDVQGQVKTVARPSGTITYSYDAAANRTELNVASAPEAKALTVSMATSNARAAAVEVDPLQALVSAARAEAYALRPPFTSIQDPAGPEPIANHATSK